MIYIIKSHINSAICDALNRVFKLDLDKEYYQPKELNKKIKKFQNKFFIQHFKMRANPYMSRICTLFYYNSVKNGIKD